MDATHHIAIDLGASNGRVIVGRLDAHRLALHEVARFEHSPIAQDDRLVWDWGRILDQVHRGLAAAAELGPAASVSCDAWAQDFGLLDGDGYLIGAPVSYRDPRTRGMPESFANVIAPDDLVRRVGSVAAPITTLCQLRALAVRSPDVLDRAATMLHIADLVHYDLTGVAATDRTLASASQLCSLSTGDWDRDLLGALGIPDRILPPILRAPTTVGQVRRLPGLCGVPVALTAGHDTAAASAVLGGAEEGVAFLMSGTWSMLGLAMGDVPAIESPAREGLAILALPYRRWGLFRPLMGLWVIQECRRAWALGHEEIVEEARRARSDSLIDLDLPRFAAHADMPGEIRSFCRETGQRVPESIGETARVVFASMAANHALAVEGLSQTAGVALREFRIVGGGSANDLLCRLTADALGIPVIAGPVEASAMGNLLLQAQATGVLGEGAEAARAMAERSFELRRYEPAGERDTRALDRLRELRAGNRV